MSLVVLGLDHRTAPVDLREQLSVEREQLTSALSQLSQYVPQSVILSTCNRTEVYTYHSDDDSLAGRISDFLIAYSGVPRVELERHLYQLWEADCALHLFRVAGGLESMIVGERQILGQVRSAFSVASETGYSSNPITRMFHSALRAGRRVHRETNIGRHSRSVSRAAVQLARGMFSRLDDKRALVIGAGDAGRMVARALADAGVQQITVTNRTAWRAEDLAKELGGVSAPFEDLSESLSGADLVISSTGSPGFVVSTDSVRQALVARGSREPLMLIDIAVPRDVDPAVNDLVGARLYDIDALGQLAESGLDSWNHEVERASSIIDEECSRFIERWNSSDTMELIASMRRRADSVRRAEVARTLRMLGADEDSELAERLDSMTNALVKKLLHRPTAELRSANSANVYPLAERLFGEDGETGRGSGRQ